MNRPTDRQCLGCRAPIERRYVACSACWWRLPLAVRASWGLRQATDAAKWFKDNPEERQ